MGTQVIDMHTSGPQAGQIKMPMRRVDGAEAWRVRAFIRLVTYFGEWPTGPEQGLRLDRIAEGRDEEIQIMIGDQLREVEGTGSDVKVTVSRSSTTTTLDIRTSYGGLPVALGVTL